MRALIVGGVSLWLTLSAFDARAADGGAPRTAGAACAAGTDCDSGFCADHVCCNVACDGTCETCVATKKQSRKGTGTCGPVRAGTDPDDECAGETATSCGKTGQCSGAVAACAVWPLGTACDVANPTECQNGSFLGRACTGQGACSVNPYTSPTSCGDYVCQRDDGGSGACATPCPGHCASPCSTNADCADTQKLCVGGACVAKLDPGGLCTTDGECKSGHCVDGLCCSTACPGNCQACNLPGTEGTCTNAIGSPPPNRQPCAGTGSCLGQCNGQPECFYPGKSTPCGEASCDGNSLVPVPTCDGAGACHSSAGRDCGDFACDGTNRVCFTSCTTIAECAGGRVCQTASHSCASQGASCDGDYAVKAPDGTSTSCNGYRCIVDRCQGTCASALDCAPGYGCVDSHCAASTDAGTAGASSSGGSPATARDAGSGTGGASPPSTKSTADGGCGCRTSRGGSNAGIWALLTASLLLLTRRARSRYTMSLGHDDLSWSGTFRRLGSLSGRQRRVVCRRL